MLLSRKWGIKVPHFLKGLNVPTSSWVIPLIPSYVSSYIGILVARG
jgi:hypothetical protein